MTVRGLTKRFAGKPALDQMSFSIESGRIIGLMGPNGAGKTTLIKTIMQLYRPDQGEILFNGTLANYHAREFLSYMPDINPLFNWMNVQDAIHYYQDFYPDFDLNYAKELCGLLQLDKKEKVKHLSKGTIDYVVLMLTFARKARLYLLDEPIGAIDPSGREKIIKIIMAGINDESSVLVSTHLVKDIETVVDDILFINKGRLLVSESADEIREKRGQSIEEYYLEVFQNA
jgi:ABC-2 type transport system ATP-binding protein